MSDKDDIVERETANLIAVISDIRAKSGVGVKPMLSELADAIAARIAELEAEVERLRPRAALCEQAWQDVVITLERWPEIEKIVEREDDH